MSRRFLLGFVFCLFSLVGCAQVDDVVVEETAVSPPTPLPTSTAAVVETAAPPVQATAVPTTVFSDSDVSNSESTPVEIATIDPATFGEGALIGVSINGSVGILLNEFPADMRDRVAASLIAQPAAYWLGLAEKQVDFTYHRLHFRDFVYAGKGQLPLPPKSLWTISLGGAPIRATEQGRDYVLVDYQFSSTLLTDAVSPGEAEPLLGEIGGVWKEPFILPLDPNVLLQRTGNACLNEAGFPPNSYDSENVRDFYDFACTPDSVGTLGCHRTIVPSASCLEMLDARVGRLETAVRFERLPWDDALADQVRLGDVTQLDQPDLQVVGDDLFNHRIIYRYFDEESCALQENAIGAAGWRRLLQFDATVHNIGGTALDIGAVVAEDPLTNMFTYNACHDHFHFSNYGEFGFESEGQAAGSKQAFCVESTSRFSNNETSPLTHDFSCSFQGIQAGWVDEYGAGLDVQWIDVTDVEIRGDEATAVLSFISNSDQFLCEGTAVTDEQGNPLFEPTGFRTETGLPISRRQCDFPENWDATNVGSRTISFQAEGSFVTLPCQDSAVGPLRNCGFSLVDDSMTCTPGEVVSLNISIENDAQPQLIRVCEVSSRLESGVACAYEDSFVNQIVFATGESISFTCPGVRDGGTFMGGFSVYAASVFGFDATVPVMIVEPDS